MLGWILNNFAIFLTVIVILIAIIVVLLIFLNRKPNVEKVTKPKKEEKQEKEKADDGKPVNEEPGKDTSEDDIEKKIRILEQEEDEERKKKVDYEEIDKKVSEAEKGKKKKKLFAIKKKEVSRVFEPKKQEEVKAIPEPEISEEQLLKDKQFVKSGKRVSKLVLVQPQETAPEEALSEEPVEEEQPAEPEPASKPSRIRRREGYFDRSKRLRTSVEKNSFDDMFASHITGDYLTIESDRHLREDKYSESLFKRTSDMLANSSAKVLISGENNNKPEAVQRVSTSSTSIKNDKDYMRDWLDQKRHEELFKIMSNTPQEEQTEYEDEDDDDDLNLGSKNLLVVSSVMKRKKLKK